MLVKKFHALNIKIVTVDESYSSSVCPRQCNSYVESIGFRVKYCKNCNIHYHRDLLGGENIYNIGINVLESGNRPEFIPSFHHQGNVNTNTNTNLNSMDLMLI